MSVVFMVVPAVATSWPILCAAVAAAAGTLGYKTLQTAGRLAELDAVAHSGVAVDLAGSQVLADAMRRESSFTITRDDVRATFRREADGRCTVHVSGPNRSTAELEALGQELVGRVTQQYAYNQVMTELKGQGFHVANENVDADGVIRVRVTRAA